MKIRICFKALYAIIALLLLSGCMINDINQYSSGQNLKPDTGRALVVIGLGAEGLSKNETVLMKFDEYDTKEQRITGGCWFYNVISAHASISDKPQYLVFDVPAGFYTQSVFQHLTFQTPNNKNIAFLAPEKQVVYFGDFVEVDKKKFERRVDFNAATSAIKKMYPEFKGTLVVADTLPIPKPYGFLCTP